jgi:hypothetical protein
MLPLVSGGSAALPALRQLLRWQALETRHISSVKDTGSTTTLHPTSVLTGHCYYTLMLLSAKGVDVGEIEG